ncbi:MAG: SUMF1/EgtB/PvdO family nonheme iron enzyme, partial [Myxococcota bacterium]
VELDPAESTDVDIHLIAEGELEDGTMAHRCITRDDWSLGSPVEPGRYLIAVDSWVDAADEVQSGPYAFDVRLITDGVSACQTRPVACTEELPPFVNLDVDEEPGDPGCLPGMVRVTDELCIDRYEAFVVELVEDGYTPVSPYAPPPHGADLMAIARKGSVPQGHIDQLQADDACRGAGKRLCDDDEWLFACRGSGDHDYPYGDTWVEGRCNGSRACHPAVQYFESSENWVFSGIGHPCMSQLPEGLLSSGSYGACVTETGAFDMVGGLHEWTSDPAGTFRGGFFVDTIRNGAGCRYRTVAHTVHHHDYSTGFRCCADAM